MPSDFTLRVSVLKDLIEAIGAAGDAIKHLTDGFAYLIRTGISGYDQVKLRMLASRLRAICALATSLRSFQEVLWDCLGKYATTPFKDEAARKAKWDEVAYTMEEVLNSVLSLLERIEQDRSDFVLQPAYAKLIETLRARSSLLQKLLGIQFPNTPEELALVREGSERYRALIDQLEAATDELIDYVSNRL